LTCGGGAAAAQSLEAMAQMLRSQEAQATGGGQAPVTASRGR
jgi:hypothetical protein